MIVAINGRAAVRCQIGGVERLAREMTRRLPELGPGRYRVLAPPRWLAHKAGHGWEQAVLPAASLGCELIYSPANLAPLASRRNAIVIHDAAIFRHPEAYSRGYVAYQRAMLPALAKRARLLIAPSNFAAGELVEVLGADPGRVRVIPEGVDEAFGRAPGAPGVLAPYGLNGPYVLALGTVSARKNLAALAPAAAALRARGIELVLAGGERGYLPQMAVPVRRLGYVAEDHLQAVYAGARAFAMPSTYEGFGLPCLEAMACGTPVVAAASGALPETVGDAGLLVDPGDGRAFAEALVCAATDEALRERLIAAGRRRAGTLTWDRTARLTDAAITEVAREGGRLNSSACPGAG